MIRPIRDGDLPAVLELNQGALHAVSPLDANRLSWIVGLADRSLVAEVSGDIAGFVITVAPRAAYDSSNYRWFEARYDTHCYLDRVVIAAAHRRTGIGSLLYDAIEAGATGPVTLEVNAEPPNVASLAFHLGRGYTEVGRLAQPDGKITAMFANERRPESSAP